MMPLDDSLGGGVFWPFSSGYSAIALDTRLTQVERNSVLAHELVHFERGGLSDHPDAPQTWRPVVAREERWTDDEAVRRLVPTAELRDFCFTRLDIGEATEPHHVAEEFGVTEHVAERALSLLGRGGRR